MTIQWYIDVFETSFLLGDGVKHMFALQHHLHFYQTFLCTNSTM
jgi:hypothetical protein